MNPIDARKQEEMEFHDRLRTNAHIQRWSPEAEHQLKDAPLWANFKYYAVEGETLALMTQWLAEHSKDATVLDYCCGNGEEAINVARMGARRVVGIDISPVSIENCRELARREHVDDRVEFQVMDAEALDFPDNSFDFIMEYGVLHHLDLDRGMAELARVLKPGGCMVCVETLGHNPLIHAYRLLTPKLRTKWEVQHILTRKSFQIIGRHFGSIERRFFNLTTLAAVPLRHMAVFGPVLAALRLVDAVLLKLPGVRWQAWQVVFRISNPRKPAASRPRASSVVTSVRA